MAMGTARPRRRSRGAVSARRLSNGGAAFCEIRVAPYRPDLKGPAPHTDLVQRRRVELALDALEMIEPLDRTVELGALFLSKLFFHLGDLVGEPCPIQLLQRGGDIGQHRQTLVGYFGKTAEHDDLLMCAARRHREDPRPDRGHHRRMSSEHAEIALDAGNVNLIDFAGEGEFFRRNEIEVEGGHGLSACFTSPACGGGRPAQPVGWGSLREKAKAPPQPSPASRGGGFCQAASAASILPFSTASSMVPTM